MARFHRFPQELAADFAAFEPTKGLELAAQEVAAVKSCQAQKCGLSLVVAQGLKGCDPLGVGRQRPQAGWILVDGTPVPSRLFCGGGCNGKESQSIDPFGN